MPRGIHIRKRVHFSIPRFAPAAWQFGRGIHAFLAQAEACPGFVSTPAWTGSVLTAATRMLFARGAIRNARDRVLAASNPIRSGCGSMRSAVERIRSIAGSIHSGPPGTYTKYGRMKMGDLPTPSTPSLLHAPEERIRSVPSLGAARSTGPRATYHPRRPRPPPARWSLLAVPPLRSAGQDLAFQPRNFFCAPLNIQGPGASP